MNRLKILVLLGSVLCGIVMPSAAEPTPLLMRQPSSFERSEWEFAEVLTVLKDLDPLAEDFDSAIYRMMPRIVHGIEQNHPQIPIIRATLSEKFLLAMKFGTKNARLSAIRNLRHGNVSDQEVQVLKENLRLSDMELRCTSIAVMKRLLGDSVKPYLKDGLQSADEVFKFTCCRLVLGTPRIEDLVLDAKDVLETLGRGDGEYREKSIELLHLSGI